MDGLIFGGASGVSKIVFEALNDTLPTKYLGDLTWYMGVDYKHDKENSFIALSQTIYALEACLNALMFPAPALFLLRRL